MLCVCIWVLRTNEGLFIEYKNVDFVNNPLTPNSQSADQFINGYLRNSNSLDDIQWQADFRKLESGWGSRSNALEQLKLQWQNVFTSRADDVFNANADLFRQAGINNVAQFRAAAGDLNSVLYNFIRVQ